MINYRSDASEEGAGSAIAIDFIQGITVEKQEANDRVLDSLVVNDGIEPSAPSASCSVCARLLAADCFSCVAKCGFRACSLQWWSVHAEHQCVFAAKHPTNIACVGGVWAEEFAGHLARLRFFPKVISSRLLAKDDLCNFFCVCF